MQNKYGFKGYKHWYKGNLHSHTTVSDGTLTPDEDVEKYKKLGYQFLCISDHDTYTDFSKRYNTDKFIILPGLEASAKLMSADGKRCLKVHHMHGILGNQELQEKAELPLFQHMEKLPCAISYGTWDGQKEAQRLCDQLRKRGCITTYNHPLWSRVSEDEFIHTQGIDLLEIYNYGTEIERGIGYDSIHWDRMLSNGYRVHAFASDDNHNKASIEDCGGGYIMVNADHLDHESIVTSILEGNYYISTGPEIYSFKVEDNCVSVFCSEVESINFIVGNIVGAGQMITSKPIQTICSAEYELTGEESYVRVECTDIYGRKAWTNSYFL